MVLNGIPLIDESYGTYTKDEDIRRMRQKKRLIFGWVGFVLLGLASILLFLLSTWTIALIALAAAIALCLSNLLLLRALK
jgi:ABC-type transport system involved in cytochrome bd biosynthesis fused ATPase/permease subunit